MGDDVVSPDHECLHEGIPAACVLNIIIELFGIGYTVRFGQRIDESIVLEALTEVLFLEQVEVLLDGIEQVDEVQTSRFLVKHAAEPLPAPGIGVDRAGSRYPARPGALGASPLLVYALCA